MPAPTSSTEWASSITALTLQPTAVQNEKGWDTDDGTVLGVPEKPTLQYDNGWQKNVHEWIEYVTTDVQFIALIPPGTVMPLMGNITGAEVPGTGAVLYGWMLCDNSVIPGGNALSGNTPLINDDRFIMGAVVSGTTGGSNSRSLIDSNMPSHTHSDGTYTTSISGGPFASSGHRQTIDSNMRVPMHIYFSGGTEGVDWRFRSDTSVPATFYYSKEFSQVGSTSRTHGTGIKPSGQTETPSSTSSLGGSNSVTGNSSYTGSGSLWDSRPNYLSVQYIIKVT